MRAPWPPHATPSRDVIDEHGSRRPPEAAAARPAPPLFVAVNAACNLTCWYCTEHGENRSFGGRLSTARLLQLLGAAHDQGVRTFRFTGGEPTYRQDLGLILRETQALSSDVRIALTTNGARLEAIRDDLATLNAPSIFLSVDSTRPPDPHAEFPVEKWLSPALSRTIERLGGIAHLRFNFVLTRSTAPELPELLEAAAVRGIDTKIFELLLRDFHYVGARDPRDVFSEQYLSVQSLLPGLEARLGPSRAFGGTGGRGIPMRVFGTRSPRVIYFDSTAGSHYGETCANCVEMPCQEGLYALVLDANGTLHPAGCTNRALYRPLATAGPATVATALQTLQHEIDHASLQPGFRRAPLPVHV